MMKPRRMLCLLLTGLLSISIAARAEEADTIAGISKLAPAAEGGAIPYIEFTNTPGEANGLDIRKTVESDPELTPPDAEFHFTIRVNGDFYRNEEYTVFDAEGQPVRHMVNASGASVQVEVPFTTDRNGGFTLLSGQTAHFDLPLNANYEITEEEIPDNFRLTEPPGGVAVGHVELNGAYEEFVNAYSPTTTETEYADLRVSKRVNLPDGLVIPGARDEEFSFRLLLNYEPCAGQKYTVYDSQDRVVRSGATDQDGKFTLKADEYAVFGGLATNQDYRVEEQLPDGGRWSISSQTGSEGAIRGPVTYADFVNAMTAFRVTKAMADGSLPDTEFGFVLGDGNGSPVSGAEYYRYDRQNNLIDGNSVTAGIQSFITGADGGFTLRAGETALFVGLEAGAGYTVRERTLTGYVQTYPTSLSGYEGTVRGDAVDELRFENAVAAADLMIVKQSEEEMILNGAGFKLRDTDSGKFATMVSDSDGWTLTGWDDAPDGGTEMSTMNSGRITINGLREGRYTLVETKTPTGYNTMADIPFTVDVRRADDGSFRVSVTLDESAAGRYDVALAESPATGNIFVLTLTNYHFVPATGGPGVLPGMLLSAALCLLGAALLLLARPKQRR